MRTRPCVGAVHDGEAEAGDQVLPGDQIPFAHGKRPEQDSGEQVH